MPKVPMLLTDNINFNHLQPAVTYRSMIVLSMVRWDMPEQMNEEESKWTVDHRFVPVEGEFTEMAEVLNAEDQNSDGKVED